MEFARRNDQVQPAQTPAPVANNNQAWTSGHKKSEKFGMWLRFASVALLFSGTVLLVAIAGLLYYGNGSESRYVDSSKYQAVDINLSSTGGSDQLYFGHIVKINSRFLVLQDVYYTTPSQLAESQSTANFTLIKSGCERVGAYDQMIINREHVIFWENLQSSGTIAQKISQDKTAHPNGPNCSTQTSTQTSNPTATTTSPTTTTTPSTSSTTKNSTTTPTSTSQH